MVDKIDPQVQIRILDIAEKWADIFMQRDVQSTEAAFNKRIENFDKAYKAITKTVASE